MVFQKNNGTKEEEAMIGIFRKKCVFCKQGGQLELINHWYWKNRTHHRYHIACLEDVLCRPENYSSVNAATAIEIVDALKQEAKEKESLHQRARERGQDLKNMHSGEGESLPPKPAPPPPPPTPKFSKNRRIKTCFLNACETDDMCDCAHHEISFVGGSGKCHTCGRKLRTA